MLDLIYKTYPDGEAITHINRIPEELIKKCTKKIFDNYKVYYGETNNYIRYYFNFYPASEVSFFKELKRRDKYTTRFYLKYKEQEFRDCVITECGYNLREYGSFFYMTIFCPYNKVLLPPIKIGEKELSEVF